MTDVTRDKKILLPIFPSDPIGAEFCKWFWSTSESWDGWDWICGTPPTPTAKTQWRTQKNFPIQPIELWQRFLDPNEAIGVRFKTDCKYLLLDIDKASPNHPANNPADYMMVIYTLRSIGLIGYVALRSTWSGGIHLYFPLPRAVNSFKLACRARLALEREGFKIASGQLEIFPNTKPYAQTGAGFSLFNPHRLPLQPGSGSCLLDDALQPKSESVADLLRAFQTAAALQDMELLESGLQSDYDTFKKHRFNRSADSLSQWRSYLESIKAQGWTGRGQTNYILLHLAAYARVFLRLSGEQLIDAVESMAKSAPGYEQYCNHKRDIHQRAVDVAHSAEQYYWMFGDEPSRFGTYAYHFGRELGISPPQRPANNIANFKTSFQASERIKQAVATLNASGNLPDTTRARMSAIIATAKTSGRSISATTLYKPQNLPLWHPDHYQTSLEECHQELAVPPLPASDDSNSTQEDKQDLCQKEASATQQGVTPLSEPVSATPELDPQPTAKLPQSAPEALLHPLPIYEGFGVAMAGAAPTKPAPAQNSKQQGEFEGETAPDAPAVGSVPPETIRRLIKIRLEAIQKASKAVRLQMLAENRLIRGEERERLETIAKMRFLWESGEPILMAEVLAWARANPDALPFVLPPDESAISSVGAADEGDRADPNQSDRSHQV